MDTPLDRLTEQFRRLPGIGIKTARKLAYYMVQQPQEQVDAFINAVRSAKETMCFCSVCFNLASQDPCPICSDETRDRSTICVVETPQDVMAIPDSLTGQYLAGTLKMDIPARRRQGNGHSILLSGVTEHNLKNISVNIPLGVFTCITGVSGSPGRRRGEPSGNVR